jgi:16S rRNA (guanine1207-N2)-methyltransferase
LNVAPLSPDARTSLAARARMAYVHEMVDNPTRTLFHPFDAGDLPLPPAHASVLFMGAEAGFRLPDGFPRHLTAVQGFRPDFLKLRASGCQTGTVPPDDIFDVALVLCGRHRGENELRIADAVMHTRPGGLIVVAGGKEGGVGSLRKRLESGDDGLAVPLGGHVSKYHGVAFWLDRTPQAEAFAATIRKQYGDRPPIEGRFRTTPGMFSWDRIDRGSALLAEHLPGNLAGKVADFGAGWGYLSASVLERCPAVESIDLYEADFAALEVAKQNVTSPNKPVAFHWLDLTTEPVGKRFKAIVMNPPFHAGRAAEPSLGQAMIEVAAKALAPKGRLLLVANTGLPYERIIAQRFAAQKEIARRDGFKVIEAVR